MVAGVLSRYANSTLAVRRNLLGYPDWIEPLATSLYQLSRHSKEEVIDAILFDFTLRGIPEESIHLKWETVLAYTKEQRSSTVKNTN